MEKAANSVTADQDGVSGFISATPQAEYRNLDDGTGPRLCAIRACGSTRSLEGDLIFLFVFITSRVCNNRF